MDQNTAIKVQNLSKSFKISHKNSGTLKDYFLHPFSRKSKENFQALKDINFEIKKGEWVGIIGKNGSGKSTLLKILAGVYQPDGGQAQINGKVVPFLELGVGFNPELSARENIFLNGSILGLSKKEIEEKFDKIVDFAEIRQFLDTPVKNFSSGMQVRLAFAVAMQADGDVYLLDEVLAVGDLAFQRKSINHLLFLKKQGKTILFVSHSLEDIKSFCDQVIFLDKAKIVAEGKPAEIVNRYNLSTVKKQSFLIKNEDSSVVRWGNGKVRITDVKLFNEKNEEVNLINYNDNIVFRIYYIILQPIDVLRIGIGVYAQDDTYCLGLNTQMDNWEIDIKYNKEQYIDLSLEQVPFFTGRFYLNVVAFGNNEKDAYDWLGNYLNFVVASNLGYRGLINIKHNWIKEHE